MVGGGCEGVRSKSSATPSKSSEDEFMLQECPGNFCRDVPDPGVGEKVHAKDVCARLRPLNLITVVAKIITKNLFTTLTFRGN